MYGFGTEIFWIEWTTVTDVEPTVENESRYGTVIETRQETRCAGPNPDLELGNQAKIGWSQPDARITIRLIESLQILRQSPELVKIGFRKMEAINRSSLFVRLSIRSCFPPAAEERDQWRAPWVVFLVGKVVRIRNRKDSCLAITLTSVNRLLVLGCYHATFLQSMKWRSRIDRSPSFEKKMLERKLSFVTCLR